MAKIHRRLPHRSRHLRPTERCLRPHERMSHRQAKTRDANSDYRFSGSRRNMGHARFALQSIHTRDYWPLGQCHCHPLCLKIWGLPERRELPLLLGKSGLPVCFRTRWRWQMLFTPMRAMCVVTVLLVIAIPAQSVSAQETAKGLLAVQARA